MFDFDTFLIICKHFQYLQNNVQKQQFEDDEVNLKGMKFQLKNFKK